MLSGRHLPSLPHRIDARGPAITPAKRARFGHAHTIGTGDESVVIIISPYHPPCIVDGLCRHTPKISELRHINVTERCAEK